MNGGPGISRSTPPGARYGLFVTLAGWDGRVAQGPGRGPLPAGTVHTSTTVRRISRNEPVSAWLVELLDGPPLEADAVVVATEAHAAARFLDAQDPACWRASAPRAIPYASSLIGQHRLSPRPDQPSPGRLWGRRAGHRGAIDPGRVVPLRHISEPGPRGNGPLGGFSSGE